MNPNGLSKISPLAVQPSAASVDDIVGSLGRPFVTAIVLACKVYPTCGFNAPAIQGLLELTNESRLTLDDVESVEIERASLSPEVLLYDWPRDGLEARFSVRYNVAAALALGAVDLAAFDEASLQDPRLRSAFDRVRLVDGGSCGSDATMLRIRTRDGRVLERATAMRSVAGSYYNRLSDADLRAKFEANARRALAAERVTAAADAWERIADAPDVRAAMTAVC